MDFKEEAKKFNDELKEKHRKSVLDRLLELSNRTKAMILTGLILVGSAAYAKNVKAEVQASNDPEVKFSDLMGEEMLDVVFVNEPKTKLDDIRNDDQVRERAKEILSRLSALGFLPGDFTEDEIFNYLKLIGGQNPFDRPVEIEDTVFMMNRIYVIMNQEKLNSARTLRGFAKNDSNQQVFDYVLFLPDNNKGNNIVDQLQQYRHGMILNPTKDGAYPYANEFVRYIYYVYLTNGFGANYPSYYEAETSGSRLIGIQLVMNTAELGASIGSQVSYQAEETIDGKTQYCDWDIQKVVNALNEANCDDTKTGMMVNPLTEAMFGTIHEANSNEIQYVYKAE